MYKTSIAHFPKYKQIRFFFRFEIQIISNSKFKDFSPLIVKMKYMEKEINNLSIFNFFLKWCFIVSILNSSFILISPQFICKHIQIFMFLRSLLKSIDYTIHKNEVSIKIMIWLLKTANILVTFRFSVYLFL